MLYTKESIRNIVKKNRNNLENTIFILNDTNNTTRQGKFVSLNKKYIKIKNNIHGVHNIAISNIKNIVTVN